MAVLFHCEGWPEDAWLAQFARQAPDLDVRPSGDAGDPEEIEYAFVWKPSSGLLERFANLKLIISAGAGVDHLLSLPALPDVPVSRVVDADLTTRMGEYIAQQALMHLRRQQDFSAFQARREWRGDITPPTARQVSAGIMGLGELGRKAARTLRLLGFDVAGWSRTPRTLDGVRCFSGEDQLGAFLGRTDILACLLPLTEMTRGILNLDLFKRLKRGGALGGPVLINAGRGGLQRDADILAALESGLLKAASLDVFETEPLPHDSPLWAHPDVIITPHVAAVSSPEAVTAYALRQIRRVENGQEAENLVRRARGY